MLRETLLRRIETHVETVVGRYADVATMWDVVNEAIADSGDGLLRDSVYSRTTGIDFIVTAFKAARAKDPDALLIYNDYNDHKPDKRKKVIELLTQLKQKGAPVDAYGMQGHFELGEDVIPQLRETFDALRKLGIKVVVSELDIDVVPRSRWWADDGKHRDELARYDPYKDGLPDEIARKQAEQYAALFRLFDEYSDLIERVSFWNLHDGESWLNDFPWRRVNHPLLFDRSLRPKPAFDAVYATLKTPRTAHAPVERRDPNSRIGPPAADREDETGNDRHLLRRRLHHATLGGDRLPQAAGPLAETVPRLERGQLRLGRRHHAQHPLASAERRARRRLAEGRRAAGRHEQSARERPGRRRGRRRRRRRDQGDRRHVPGEGPRGDDRADGTLPAPPEQGAGPGHRADQRAAGEVGRREEGSLRQHQRPVDGRPTATCCPGSRATVCTWKRRVTTPGPRR